MIKNWEVYKKQERDAVFFDGYKYEDEGSSFNLLVFDSNYETTYYKIFLPVIGQMKEPKALHLLGEKDFVVCGFIV